MPSLGRRSSVSGLAERRDGSTGFRVDDLHPPSCRRRRVGGGWPNQYAHQTHASKYTGGSAAAPGGYRLAEGLVKASR
jgi:hypothetical protein